MVRARRVYFFAGSVVVVLLELVAVLGAAPGVLVLLELVAVLGVLGVVELELLALLAASFAGSAGLAASDEVVAELEVLGAGAGAAGAGVVEDGVTVVDFCSVHAVNATTSAAAKRSVLFIGVPLE